MKRKFSIAAGLCLMVAASAIGRSEMSDVLMVPSLPEAATQTQVDVESLTSDQRLALQARYKYWRSSAYSFAKAPL